MSTTKLNPDQVLLLEQDLLRVSPPSSSLLFSFPPLDDTPSLFHQAPLDTLRRLQKTTAKSYEYNMTALQKDLDQILLKTAKAASTSSSQLDPQQKLQISKSVDAMLSRMKGLKRKLVELENQTEQTNQIIKHRLNHLDNVPSTLEDQNYPVWAQKRLSHHLVDYMLRSNPPLKRSAEILAKEEKVESLVDKELWDEMGKVEVALAEKKLEEVLSWVGENRTALKKLKVSFAKALSLLSFDPC